MLIREARADEFGELGDLRVAAYLADGFLTPGSHYAPELRALGADGRGQVLVAVPEDTSDQSGTTGQAGAGRTAPAEAGRIAGTVMLQGWPDGEVLAGQDEAEVRALAVAPGARGSGLGRALLDAVIQRAQLAGVRHLVLLTQPAMKAAHHLYDEAGFARLPDRDWSPVPGLTLLAYGLVLPAGRPNLARACCRLGLAEGTGETGSSESRVRRTT